ncbi:MAG: hypothetical protein HRT88_00860 [Lentisphaeraceae bacterium]|nr:hypothetical protein [Lentisphaeraceae bacterium]
MKLFTSLLLAAGLLQATPTAKLIKDNSAVSQKELQMKSYAFVAIKKEAQQQHIKAIHGALQSTADRSTKNLLITQLQLCGGSESIDILALLLNDPKLAYKAASALQTISRTYPAKIKAVAVKALQTCPASTSIAVIKLAGWMTVNDKQSIAKLIAFSKIESSRQSSLESLAQSGSEQAVNTLSTSLTEKGVLRRRNIKLNLLLARSLPKTAGLKHLNFIKSKIKDNEISLHLQAIASSIEINSAVNKEIITLLHGENLKLTSGLIHILKNAKDESLNSKLASELQTKPAAAILRLYHLRAPKGARSHLLAALSSDNENLKEVAIELAASLPVSQTVPTLIASLMKAEKSQTKNLISILSQLPAAASILIRDCWPQAKNTQQQINLLKVFVERRDFKSASIFINAAKSNDKKLRKSALKGLKTVSRGNSIQIIALLEQASSIS